MNQKKKHDKIKEQHLTYNDYANLPDDGTRYELADGVLQAMTPAPHPIHQLVNQELWKYLNQSCQNDYIMFVSPIDVILSDKEVRQPDLVMVHRSKVDIVTNRGVEGSPDLVVEILSRFSVKRDRMEKLYTYAAYDIPEYWLIDPVQKTMEQYVLKEKDYVLHEVYIENQTINSTHIGCATFSMDDIFKAIPVLPNA